MEPDPSCCEGRPVSLPLPTRGHQWHRHHSVETRMFPDNVGYLGCEGDGGVVSFRGEPRSYGHYLSASHWEKGFDCLERHQTPLWCKRNAWLQVENYPRVTMGFIALSCMVCLNTISKHELKGSCLHGLCIFLIEMTLVLSKAPTEADDSKGSNWKANRKYYEAFSQGGIWSKSSQYTSRQTVSG